MCRKCCGSRGSMRCSCELLKQGRDRGGNRSKIGRGMGGRKQEHDYIFVWKESRQVVQNPRSFLGPSPR